jgi:hypothetical protein
MKKFKGLRQASHFGPTLIVTAIAFAFGTYYWWEGPAYVIAFTVATGQLVVGWSNDLYDFQDDLKHNRTNKQTTRIRVNHTKVLTKMADLHGSLFLLCKLIWPVGIQRRNGLHARYRLRSRL